MFATRSAAALAALVVSLAAPGVSAAASLPTYESWMADIRVVADEATRHLATRLPAATRTAIVLDIDNTSLDSTFSPGHAVVPVREVVQLAKARGAAVFFVSDRREPLRAPTTANLESVGYPVDGLMLRDTYDFQPVQSLKTAARAAIEALGYTIVANIGNNTTDLAGGHAERTFKLPDYDGLLM